jgi:hypothetical protein
MGTVAEAAQTLEAALRAVEGLRVYRDPGAAVDPPAAIVGLPALGWRGYCGSQPNHARFRIDVIVRSNERANEHLWELAAAVAAAVEMVSDAVLAPVEEQATPTQFTTGQGTQLPGYQIQVDYEL